MKRKIGLMYERMCFQRGKGKAMAAGPDNVPVLLLCQYLLWLPSTFPPALINAAIATIASLFED